MFNSGFMFQMQPMEDVSSTIKKTFLGLKRHFCLNYIFFNNSLISLRVKFKKSSELQKRNVYYSNINLGLIMSLKS